MTPFELACYASNHLGFSVIPLGSDKRPLVKWERYQTEKATIEQLQQWQDQYHSSAWGVVTGAISNIFVLDFDGETGINTMHAWDLEPYVRSGSGGYHVYFTHPGTHVINVSHLKNKATKEHWAGVDVRGDGGYVVLSGQNANGPYDLLRELEHFYQIDILLPSVRQALIEDYPQQTAPRTDPFDDDTTNSVEPTGKFALSLIQRAIDQEIDAQGGRDNAGLWLACQLRDNGCTEAQILECMYLYADYTPNTDAHGNYEPYTYKNVEATVKSVLDRPPRSPWTLTSVPTQSSKEYSYPIRYIADMFAQDEQKPWLIQNRLRKEMSGMLYGNESTGKSGIAIDIAFHMAFGLQDWHGLQIEPGIVAIVAGEGAYDIELLEHAFILDYEDNHPGVTLSRDTKNFLLIPTGVPIDNAQAIDALITEIKEELGDRQLSLLLFDTLATCLEKASPDANADMIQVGRYMRKIQNELHCSTMIITHTGHNPDRLRGASDMTRSADVVWKMEYDIGNDLYMLYVKKLKGQSRPKDVMRFKQEVIALPTKDNFGAFETGYVLKRDTSAAAAQAQVIHDATQDAKMAVLNSLDKHGTMQNKDLSAACSELGIGRKRYEDARDWLVKEGYVRCRKGDPDKNESYKSNFYDLTTASIDYLNDDTDPFAGDL
jgi:hypothetical protein